MSALRRQRNILGAAFGYADQKQPATSRPLVAPLKLWERQWLQFIATARTKYFSMISEQSRFWLMMKKKRKQSFSL
tara:strand:- start:898 stop:1125 length:228 start_codon:yes stop_codon:yes gene_type:complete